VPAPRYFFVRRQALGAPARPRRVSLTGSAFTPSVQSDCDAIAHFVLDSAVHKNVGNDAEAYTDRSDRLDPRRLPSAIRSRSLINRWSRSIQQTSRTYRWQWVL